MKVTTAAALGALLLLGFSTAEAKRRTRQPPPIWQELRPPLSRYISRNVRENGGYFLIEDSDRANSWMGRLRRIYKTRPMRVNDNEYIVRALFTEKSFDNPKITTRLLVDFTLARNDEGRWAVDDVVIYKIDRKTMFKYVEGFRRQSIVPKSGVLTVTINGDEVVEPEDDRRIREDAKRQFRGERDRRPEEPAGGPLIGEERDLGAVETEADRSTREELERRFRGVRDQNPMGLRDGSDVDGEVAPENIFESDYQRRYKKKSPRRNYNTR